MIKQSDSKGFLNLSHSPRYGRHIHPEFPGCIGAVGTFAERFDDAKVVP